MRQMIRAGGLGRRAGPRTISGGRIADAGLLAAVLGGMLVAGGGREVAEGARRGNPVEGRRLFATLACASCHDVAHPWPGGDICPNLGNIGSEAARIVRLPGYRGKARDAAGYIRESILDPNAYIVPGASYRTADGQSVMPKDFGRTLTPAQIDDLVAFLLERR